MKRSSILAALLALAFTLPAGAGETIYGGTDLWSTPADGTTYSDFAAQPLPAGFFCARSAAFTGRVAFKGVPLATDSPEVLGNTDTVIERLDNAVLDANGKAQTRLQVRALQLASIAPIQTACGAYNVRATLVGRQPVTTMKIFREGDDGGRFLAPLALNVKLTFTPVQGGRSLEMMQNVRFPADPRASFALSEDKGFSSRYVRIDTDGDGRADTLVPGPSNFRAGANRKPDDKTLQAQEEVLVPEETLVLWHTAPTHAHRTTLPRSGFTLTTAPAN